VRASGEEGDVLDAPPAPGNPRKASESTRGPVTQETVKRLSSERSLRGVAQVAKKYAK